MNRYQEAMMALPSIESAVCPFCGRLASNRHHIVPRSQGGKDGPTVTVCGFGNAAGCHGLLHSHVLHLRPDGRGWWEWLRTDAPCKHEAALALPPGDISLDGKYLFPVCCALAAWLRPSIFPDGRNASGLCGELDMPLRLISGHLKVGKLDLNKAFRLFHELLTVNADTDFLKAVCRQRNDIAIAGHGIRALAIFILIRRCNIHQQLLCPQRGGVDPKITNIQHG